MFFTVFTFLSRPPSDGLVVSKEPYQTATILHLINSILFGAYYTSEGKQFRDVFQTLPSMSNMRCTMICAMQQPCKGPAQNAS